MDYLTFVTDELMASKVQEFYAVPLIHKSYLQFKAISDNVIITAYYNNKNEFKIIYSGFKEEILKEASIFFDLKKGVFSSSKTSLESKKKNETTNKGNQYLDVGTQIGSDEVGFGDFFGGVTVCAAYLKAEELPYLLELGVTDSKKMNDKYIKEIGETLLKTAHYYSVYISPDKYNEMIEKGFNVVNIKAKLHNLCHQKLIERYHLSPSIPVYVDEFVNMKAYLSKLDGAPHPSKLIFHTKGETYYPSVALASVIARYQFLLEFDKLNKKSPVELKKGAGELVDEVGRSLFRKIGRAEFNHYVKVHFANYQRIKEDI